MVYVVIESFDSRSGGHEVKIHGIFSDKEKALSCMKIEATKLQKQLEGEIEEGKDWFNVISGEDYYVFEIGDTFNVDI